MRRLGMIIGLCAILALAGTVYCLAAAKPTGKVVLTVTGGIAETNSDKGLELDMAMLEGIGTKLYEGAAPWLGKKKYTGVTIADILKFAGASKCVVEVMAIAKDGKKVFRQCQACHVADKKQNRVGPYLLGVIGRPAGTAEGFKYSDAMANSGVVWDETTITAYLTNPKEFIPGNKMVFAGLKKPEQIEDVIAYLESVAE